VSMIEELIAKETDPVVLDSAEVTRRPRGGRVPRNLRCEGIRLRNCPGFIEFVHEWMSKVEGRELRQQLCDRDEAAADGSYELRATLQMLKRRYRITRGNSENTS
jgi:hypothetical protein